MAWLFGPNGYVTVFGLACVVETRKDRKRVAEFCLHAR